MLLYYFRDKDELLTALLEHVVARFTPALKASGPLPHVLHFPGLLGKVRRTTGSEPLRPFMRLWIQLAAAAARNEEPHRTLAGRIANAFADWIAARLVADREVDRAAQAALLFATLDGLVLLDAVGRKRLAERAVRASGPR